MAESGAFKKSQLDKQSNLPKQNENGKRQTRAILQRNPSCASSELNLTEQKYIADLSKVVNEYIPKILNSKSPIKVPEDLQSKKAELVFGNIESIYKWHKDEFSTVLQRCSKDPSKFGTKMEQIEKKMLNLYTKYSNNKPISDCIVHKHEKYFNEVSDDLESLLQLPLNRIFTYKEIFLSILKDEPQHEQEIIKAIEVMERIYADVNDLMVLWQLKHFPEQIDDQGKLICHAPLLCSEQWDDNKWLRQIFKIDKPKRLQVFLLQESIIFANIIEEDKFNLSYRYYYHIKVSQIKLGPRHSDRIQLNFTDPKKKDLLSYTIKTDTKEISTKWMDAIMGAISHQEKFRSGILAPVKN